MKTRQLLPLSLCAVLLACGGREAAAPAGASPSPAASEPAAVAPRAQAGDYSALFALTDADCPLLSAEEVAQALGIPADNVEVQACRYFITLADGSKSPLGIGLRDRARAETQREIDSYRKDNTGMLSALDDDSGDNVLAFHHSRGWLFVLNPDYDRFVQLNYGTTVFAAANKGATVTDRKTVRENATKVANALIAKYRK